MFPLISEAGFILGGRKVVGLIVNIAVRVLISSIYCGFYGAAKVVRSHYRHPQRGVEKGAHCSTCFFGRVHNHRWHRLSVEIV